MNNRCVTVHSPGNATLGTHCTVVASGDHANCVIRRANAQLYTTSAAATAYASRCLRLNRGSAAKRAVIHVAPPRRLQSRPRLLNRRAFWSRPENFSHATRRRLRRAGADWKLPKRNTVSGTRRGSPELRRSGVRIPIGSSWAGSLWARCRKTEFSALETCEERQAIGAVRHCSREASAEPVRGRTLLTLPIKSPLRRELSLCSVRSTRVRRCAPRSRRCEDAGRTFAAVGASSEPACGSP